MYSLGLAQAYSCVAMDTKLILVNIMTIHATLNVDTLWT